MTNKGNYLDKEKNIFEPNDFVYFKSGDTIESSGYKINSILMNHNIPAMITNNILPSTNGNKVSSLLNDFAVPAGLLLLQQKSLKHYDDNNEKNDKNDVIDDDLFNKLLNLSTPIKKKKHTKRHKSKTSKSLRKTKRVN